MITKIRQINLKLAKVSEYMIEIKTKYLDRPEIYSDFHKLDVKIEEIQKLIDNSKD